MESMFASRLCMRKSTSVLIRFASRAVDLANITRRTMNMKPAIIQSISHHPFHGGCELVERRSQVADGCFHGVVSQQITDGFQGSAILFEAFGEGVAQPVGCEIRNADLRAKLCHVALQGPGCD